MIRFATEKARQIAIAVVGVALVAIGIALLVLPGPGIAVIALGVGVLAFEFETPRRWQRRVAARIRAWRKPPSESPPGNSETSATG